MLQTKDVQLSTPAAGVSVPGQSPESGRRQVVLMDGDRHHSRVLPGAGDTADTMSCLLHIYSVDSTHIYQISTQIHCHCIHGHHPHEHLIRLQKLLLSFK